MWGTGQRMVLCVAALVALTSAACTPPLPTGTYANTLSVGVQHACVLMNDATVRCWGSNFYGEVGTGTASSSEPTPRTVPGLTGVLSVSAGAFFTCAVLSDHTVKCWGFGPNGEMGNGLTPATQLTPVTVTGVSNAVEVSAGDQHACALISDGTVECWGRNFAGELGDGTNTDRLTAVPVSGLTNAATISAGHNHTCATLTDGTAECWGFGLYGALGTGTTSFQLTPTPVDGLIGVRNVWANLGDETSCASLLDGTAHCWGKNDLGQLGDGTTMPSLSPTTVSGVSTAKNASTGTTHGCAALSDGTVQCWGANNYGQLGDATTTGRLTPVTVSGLTGATAAAAGNLFSCALTTNSVACWGIGSFGSLGNGSTTNSATPVTVVALT